MTAEDTTQREETQERLPINRREFLNYAWLVSLGFFTISAAGVTYLFSLPRFKEGEFGGVVTIGKVEDLPDVDDPPDNFAKTKFWLSNEQILAAIAPLGYMRLFLGILHTGAQIWKQWRHLSMPDGKLHSGIVVHNAL